MASLSEVEGDYFQYSGSTLCGKFSQIVTDHGDRVALVCTHQAPEDSGVREAVFSNDEASSRLYLRVTYRQLAGKIAHFAHSLSSHGVRPGTPVICLMPNLAEYAIAMWAAFKLGCTWVPLSPKNLRNRREIHHMIDTALDWRSGQSAVVIASDGGIADGFDALDIPRRWLRIIVSHEERSGWQYFKDFSTSSMATNSPNYLLQPTTATQASVIMFTSGTTSLPKGVAWPIDKLMFRLEQSVTRTQRSANDIVCLTMPNNHNMGMITYLGAFCYGSTVVHPGPSFSPQDMVDTIIQESCTRLILVPTMVHALVDAMENSGKRLTSLQIIRLGGSNATPDIVDKCLVQLGAEDVHNIWGMTEGCVTTPKGVAIDTLISDGHVSVGYAPANSKVRICSPQSRLPVPRGTSGELHFSGSTLAESYIGVQSDDFYIDDEGKTWFNSGDQAMIDDEDRIFIIGRYKDIVIRAGENIAPASIEAVLAKDPELTSYDMQVIGVKDLLAGEVPVVVYRGKGDTSIAQRISKTILNDIGPSYVPDQVISLQDLNLDDFPRTTAGKVRKTQLASLVEAVRDQETASTTDVGQSGADLAQIVKKIWERALGYSIDETQPLASFADSITVMRTRDRIVRETGKTISLNEMMESINIAGQVEILQKRQSRGTSTPKSKRRAQDRAITADDVEVFRHRPAIFDRAKVAIEDILAKHELSWDNVADIAPAYDFSSVLNRKNIMDTWSVTVAVMTNLKTRQEARFALRKTLSNSPILTSLLIWDHNSFHTKSALYIMMHQTDAFLDQYIRDLDSVQAESDLERFVESYPIEGVPKLPGPLFNACLVHVEETGSIAIVMITHHAVTDGFFSLIFTEDLDTALAGKTLAEHIDYRIWAESYFSLRNSLEAQAAIQWHVSRLKDISHHRQAFWLNSRQNRPTEERAEVQVDIPQILKLRQAHPEISAPIIIKTAYALMCSYRSKYQHAAFFNFQASRDRFPFVPRALEDLGHDYSASNVAGPTIQIAVNLIQIRPEETVLDFLTRMQSNQDEQTKYSAAPLSDIIHQLGDADGSLIFEAILTLGFNWVPGFGARATNKYDNLRPVASAVKPEVGLGMDVGLGGEKGHTVFMEVFGRALRRDDCRVIAMQIARITEWLVDESNWKAEVGSYVDCLHGLANGEVST